MSHDVWKFMVHEFFEIHGPWIFWNSWSMIFWNSMSQRFLRLWLNRLAQAGGGGPYYMIFHYQKHTVLNYSCTVFKGCPSRTNSLSWVGTSKVKDKTVSPWSLPWIREKCCPNFPELCFQDWFAWHPSVPGFHTVFFQLRITILILLIPHGWVFQGQS